jgi:D-3-phosphoglycerate dehydrogenase
VAVIAVLTDADRFPFERKDMHRLAAADVQLRSVEGHAPDTIVEAAADAAAIFVYHARVDRTLLERLPELRVVARCGSGTDLIDLDAARERGIRVTYVPGFATNEVADQTIGLLLACARRIVLCDRKLRDGVWLSSTELGPLCRLRGQTLGLVGFGLIARAVTLRALALGMLVIAHDPYVAGHEFAASGASAVSFEELLDGSDVVSLHAPLTDATRRLVGPRELARMRRGAILVNTSRGELVDEQALAEAVRSGQLSAAGLDVFSVEPPPTDSPLRGLDTVVVEPHSAAFSEEALAELRERAIGDALRVLAGDEPLGAVA